MICNNVLSSFVSYRILLQNKALKNKMGAKEMSMEPVIDLK